MYVVYTEINNGDKIERWFYGAYSDKNRANEVALTFDSKYGVVRGVCKDTEVKNLKIKNI